MLKARLWNLGPSKPSAGDLYIEENLHELNALRSKSLALNILSY